MGQDSGCDLVWTDLSVSYGDKVGLKSVDEISMKVKINSEKSKFEPKMILFCVLNSCFMIKIRLMASCKRARWLRLWARRGRGRPLYWTRWQKRNFNRNPSNLNRKYVSKLNFVPNLTLLEQYRLADLVPISQGRVLYDGQELSQLEAEDMKRRWWKFLNLHFYKNYVEINQMSTKSMFSWSKFWIFTI